jgi:hypothetical protein
MPPALVARQLALRPGQARKRPSASNGMVEQPAGLSRSAQSIHGRGGSGT